MTTSDKCAVATNVAATSANIDTEISAIDVAVAVETTQEEAALDVSLIVPQHNSPTIPHPQEYLDGLWEADPFYYHSSLNGGLNGTRAGSDENAAKRARVAHRGMLYRSRVDDEYKCFLDKEGEFNT